MKDNLGKIILVAVVVVLGAAFFYFDLGQYLTLESLKSHRSSFQQYYEDNAAITILSYVGSYIIMAALSLPGATIMTLAGGAIFGFGTALVLVSFASSVGATLAFLVSRTLLRNLWGKKCTGNLVMSFHCL